MNSKHTPTPWHLGGTKNMIVFAEDGWAIANAVVHHNKSGFEKMEANAAFIVKAVNCHEELICALEDCQETVCAKYCDEVMGDHCEECRNASAALAKAKGEA